jgi:hypothetical protein
MSPEISINASLKENRIINNESECSKSAGIALLIIGLDPLRNGDNTVNPLFWTIKELENRLETNKKKGDISIPAETRKTGETRSMNLIGALAEFCDDATLPYVREHLFLADGVFRQKCINVNGNLVDVSVLIYDGNLSLPINPYNNTEVMPNAWLSRNEIGSLENIRDVFSQALEIDLKEGLSKSITDIYYTNPSSLKRVIPEDIETIAEFYRIRESIGDIPLKQTSDYLS